MMHNRAKVNETRDVTTIIQELVERKRGPIDPQSPMWRLVTSSDAYRGLKDALATWSPEKGRDFIGLCLEGLLEAIDETVEILNGEAGGEARRPKSKRGQRVSKLQDEKSVREVARTKALEVILAREAESDIGVRYLRAAFGFGCSKEEVRYCTDRAFALDVLRWVDESFDARRTVFTEAIRAGIWTAYSSAMAILEESQKETGEFISKERADWNAYLDELGAEIVGEQAFAKLRDNPPYLAPVLEMEKEQASKLTELRGTLDSVMAGVSSAEMPVVTNIDASKPSAVNIMRWIEELAIKGNLSMSPTGVVCFHEGERFRILPYFCESGEIALLGNIANDLAHRYRWTDVDATTFILFGEIPKVRGAGAAVSRVDGREAYPALTRIHLEIDPAMSPQEVARAYANARSKIRGHAVTPNPRMEALCMAVSGDASAADLERWNDEHPDWRFVNVGRMNESLKRARRVVLGHAGPKR